MPSRQSARRLESGRNGAATALPEALLAPTNAARLRICVVVSFVAKLGRRAVAEIAQRSKEVVALGGKATHPDQLFAGAELRLTGPAVVLAHGQWLAGGVQ